MDVKISECFINENIQIPSDLSEQYKPRRRRRRLQRKNQLNNNKFQGQANGKWNPEENIK